MPARRLGIRDLEQPVTSRSRAASKCPREGLVFATGIQYSPRDTVHLLEMPARRLGIRDDANAGPVEAGVAPPRNARAKAWYSRRPAPAVAPDAGDQLEMPARRLGIRDEELTEWTDEKDHLEMPARRLGIRDVTSAARSTFPAASKCPREGLVFATDRSVTRRGTRRPLEMPARRLGIRDDKWLWRTDKIASRLEMPARRLGIRDTSPRPRAKSATNSKCPREGFVFATRCPAASASRGMGLKRLREGFVFATGAKQCTAATVRQLGMPARRLGIRDVGTPLLRKGVIAARNARAEASCLRPGSRHEGLVGRGSVCTVLHSSA